MAKKKDEKKTEETPRPAIKRIRMLRDLGTARGAYFAGKSYKVGIELPEEWAKSWLKAGMAEEDKAIEEIPETK